MLAWRHTAHHEVDHVLEPRCPGVGVLEERAVQQRSDQRWEHQVDRGAAAQLAARPCPGHERFDRGGRGAFEASGGEFGDVRFGWRREGSSSDRATLGPTKEGGHGS